MDENAAFPSDLPCQHKLIMAFSVAGYLFMDPYIELWSGMVDCWYMNLLICDITLNRFPNNSKATLKTYMCHMKPAFIAKLP